MPAPAPTERDKVVGARLRIRRLGLKVSQIGLARLLGVSPQSVQKWEKGETAIGSNRLLQLAEALNVSASYFLGEGSTAPAEPITIYGASEEGIAFFEQLSRIKSVKIKRRLLAMLTEIADELDRND